MTDHHKPNGDTATRLERASSDATSFERYFIQAEPLLRRSLVAGYGADLGAEAAATALTYGWSEWARIRELENPTGYLYRVGERWARRHRPRRQLFGAIPPDEHPHVEPGLAAALDGLSLRQRQAVLLVEGFGLTYAETSDLLGISRSSTQNHLRRGMTKLRRHLGVGR